jgi:hypothetical protein
MVFFVLLAIPLLIALGGFIFSKGLVTKKEFAVQFGVQLVVAGIAAILVHYSSVHDNEFWNGRVTSKKKEWTSCTHSYDCNCTRDSKGNEHCSTCYRHFNDWDWDVYTSNGETIEINRIDEQGSDEPPRWSRVAMGEPTTLTHGYTNYIKASPGSLFRHQGLTEKYKDSIPEYPEGTHDYYHASKVVLVGGLPVDVRAWNNALAEVNADVGRPKQANILLVLVKGEPQEYFYALEEAWIGGKKNDIVLVAGVDDQLAPQWVTVMAWTTQEIFKVKLRDDIMALGPLTKDKVMDVFRTDVPQYYVRKPMAEFEYLEASIAPTPMQWGVSLFISLAIAVGLTIWFIKVDVFGEERGSWRRRGVVDYPSVESATFKHPWPTAFGVDPLALKKTKQRRRPRGL